jgi:hypothetical protein
MFKRQIPLTFLFISIVFSQSATIRTIHDIGTELSPSGYYNYAASTYNSTGGFRITTSSFTNNTTYVIKYQINGGTKTQLTTGTHVGTSMNIDIQNASLPSLSNGDKIIFYITNDAFGSNTEVTAQADDDGYYFVSNSVGDKDYFYYDVTVPTVSNVTSDNTDATKIIGQTVDIKITFSEIVDVVTSGGTPILTLETGSSDATASYNSGTGTADLIFRYTVSSGNTSSDLDYTNTSALTTNGGTIRDKAGNDATLTLATPGQAGSLGYNKNFVIDGVAPTISSINPPNDGSYKEGSILDFTVNYSEAVTVTGTPTLSLNVGGTAVNASYNSGSGSTSLVFRYTVLNGHNDSDGIALTSPVVLNGGTMQDANGNDASLTFSPPVTSGIIIDDTAPTVSSVSSTQTDGYYKAGDVIPITVTFDETVYVTGTPQITLETGTTDATVDYTSGSGSTVLTFNYTVASGQTSSDLDYSTTTSLALNGGTIKDLAGNSAVLTLPGVGQTGSLSYNKSLIVDTTAPTVSSVSSSSPDATYKIGDVIPIKVTFDETVIVTGSPQLVINTGSVNTGITYSSGSGTTDLIFNYTVSEGHSSSDLAYVSTSALSGTIKDAAGNSADLTLPTPGASGSLSANKNFVIDGVRPTVSNVTSTKADGSYKAGVQIDITITFDEIVNVTGTPQLTLETGTSDAVVNYASGSGNNTLTFSYVVSSGESSSDLSYQSTSALALNSGTIKDNAGNSATLTLPIIGSSTSLSGQKRIIIDTTAPTISDVTSTKDNGYYNAGDVIPITVTFSEDIVVSGTPKLTLETGSSDVVVDYSSGTGTSTLTFNYTVSSGENSTDLDYLSASALTPGTSIQDSAGNDAVLTLATPGSSGSLGANKNLIIDTIVPTVDSVSSTFGNGSFTVGEVIPIQVYFSESVVVSGTPKLKLNTGADSTAVSYTSGSSTNTLTLQYTVASGDSSLDLDYQSAGSLSLNGGSIADSAGNSATLTLATPGQPNSLGANKAIIIDTSSPRVLNVSSDKTNGSYTTGELIDITVLFTEAVTVTGTPQLRLNTGTDSTAADYISGSGTTTLTFRYTVASGDSSLDLDYQSAGSLSLNGGTIKDAAGNAAVLTLAAPGDPGSLGNNKALVIDAIAPKVLSVTSTATDTSYKADDVIPITVTFHEAVVVAGTPQITLNTGSSTTAVDYSSGSGTTTLTFNYTVAAGDSSLDLDYSSTTALALNSGTIKDATGNAAVLTLPTVGGSKSLGGSKDIIVDTRAPTVSLVTSTKDDGSYKAGITIPVDIVFSEPVIVSGTPQITLETGTSDETINYASGSTTDTLVFNYTVASGDTTSDLDYINTTALALNGGSIIDAAGNTAVLTLPTPGAANSLAYNKDIIIDTVAPTVDSVSSTTADGSYMIGDEIAIKIYFDENVYVTSGTPTVTLETGSTDETVNYTSGSGTNTFLFTYTVASGDSSDDLDYTSVSALDVAGGITDLAGNVLTATLPTPGASGSLGNNKDLIVDGIVPTVSKVTSSNPDQAYKTGDTLQILVIGSENLVVTGTPKMTLETGTSDAVTSYISGSGNDTLVFQYIVSSGESSSDLNYSATDALALNGGTIKDEAGNALTLTLPGVNSDSSLAGQKNIVIDTQKPSAVLTYDDPDNLVRFEDGTLLITATFSDSININYLPTIYINLPETSSDIENADMTRLADTVYTYNLSLPDTIDGIISVDSIIAYDKALNKLSADSISNKAVVKIDNTDPGIFTTGEVVAVGDTVVVNWFNAATDRLQITVPLPKLNGTQNDNSLLNGGDVDIKMRIAQRMSDTSWVSIPTSDTGNPGAPKDSIKALTDSIFSRSRQNIIDQLTPKGLTQGDTIYVMAVINDAVGNTTEGTPSSSFFILDTLPPAKGTFSTGSEFTVNKDTLISNDTLYVRWEGFSDPLQSSAAGSGIDRFEYAVKEGSGALDGFRGWRAMDQVELQSLNKTDTLLIDTLAFEHNKQYTVSVRAVDVAGNTSDLLTDSSPFLRYNTPPSILTIADTTAKEDIDYSQLVQVDDIDLTTLRGDLFSYQLETRIIDHSGSNPDTVLIDTLNASISNTGKIVFTPTKWDTADYVFRVLVTDAWGLKDTLDYGITVLPVNDAPIIDLSSVGKLEFLEGANSDTINLTAYSYDEDDDTTALKWSARILSTLPDLPAYPTGRIDFDPTHPPATIRAFRKSLQEQYPQARIYQGINTETGGLYLSLDAAGDKLKVNLPKTGDSTYASIAPVDTNYYSTSDLQVEFTVIDPGNLEGKDTITFSITPINDPPEWTGLNDTTIVENDSIYLDFANYLSDVDDSVLTITIQPLTFGSSMTVEPSKTYSTTSNGVVFTSSSKNDTVKFKPALLWFGPTGPWKISNSDSSLIQISAADSDTTVVDSFVVRVQRVPRPEIRMYVVQNNAFTNFYEVFIVDSVGKTTDLTLEIQSKQVPLDTVAAYTYVGHHQFSETQGNYIFEVRATGVVGDTTVSNTVGLAVARTFTSWTGASPDGRFRVTGSTGTVEYDQTVLIIDSTMFDPYFSDRASYLLGNDIYGFKRPVEVSLPSRETEIAIYERTTGMGWIELPSITENGRVRAYTDKMGYFRLGPKTLIVPGMTSLHQNYPNPFNPVTTIVFDLGFVDGPYQRVQLAVYNILGQNVKTLVNDEKGIGRYTVRWNGKDENGVDVASGIYFVHLMTDRGRSQTKKIMLIR